MRLKINFLTVMLLMAGIAFSCQADDSSLVIGNFKISKVTDGDTFRFEGLDNSTRLLGIDTEETFKTDDAEQKINEISANWDAYYMSERGDSKFPVKADSPFGFEAWKWAEEFLKDVDYIRLEKEADERSVDIFGRYLVYMIAIMKDGSEINYNVECVRLGYSPYFNKYGNSKRFHEEFVEAQNFAKENSLGIWDPNKKHYPDYEERIIWWDKRANQLEEFEAKYSNNEDYFNLANDKDFARLKDYVGKEITIFGSVGNVLTKKFPYLLRIPHTKEETFEIVIHEENAGIINDPDLQSKMEYYVYVKGVLEVYKDRFQIELKEKENLF